MKISFYIILWLCLLSLGFSTELKAEGDGQCDLKEVKSLYKCTHCDKILRGYKCPKCESAGKDYLFEESTLNGNFNCPNCQTKLQSADLIVKGKCFFCQNEPVKVDVCIKRVYTCPTHPDEEQNQPGTCSVSTDGKKCGLSLQLNRTVFSEIVFVYECPKCHKIYDKDGKCESCKQQLNKKKTCKLAGEFPHIKELKESALDEKGIKQKYTQLDPPAGVSMKIAVDYQADDNEITQIKQAIELFASLLWNNTAGNMFIKKVILINNSKNGYIMIKKLAAGSGGCTNQDQAIVVSGNLLNAGPPGMGYSILGAGMLHEFGHSMFHLPDEYPTGNQQMAQKDCVMDPRSRQFDFCPDCRKKIFERFTKWSAASKPGKQPKTEIITWWR